MNEIMEKLTCRLESKNNEIESLLRSALWECYDQSEDQEEFKAEAATLIDRFAPTEKIRVNLFRLFVNSNYARH